MKWRWLLLLAGLAVYALAFVPGVLPHTIDVQVAALVGVTIATIGMFGFDSTRVGRRLALLMVVVSLIILAAAVLLALQGHKYLFLLLSAPAVGLGLFRLRNMFLRKD